MKMDRRHCSGCRNNFYNGNNNLGVKQCWSLESAKLVRRIQIHRDAPPPYSRRTTKVPNCYHQTGYVFVSPDAITKQGYWK